MKIPEQIWHTWNEGGWVLIPLAIVAMIAYGTAVHLMMMLYHRGLTKVTDEDIRGWVAEPASAPRQISELIRYTQDEVGSLADIEGRFREVEAAKIPEVDRRLAFINVMVVSAPLFGLLGTVMGMLLTFKAISIGGGSTSEIIAKGVSEALVATQTGMLVALPGLILAFFIKRWRNEYAAFLARLEGITLRYFRPQFRGMTSILVRSKSGPAQAKETPAPASQLPKPVTP